MMKTYEVFWEKGDLSGILEFRCYHSGWETPEEMLTEIQAVFPHLVITSVVEL